MGGKIAVLYDFEIDRHKRCHVASPTCVGVKAALYDLEADRKDVTFRPEFDTTRSVGVSDWFTLDLV